ncbi:DNA-binding protein [Agreia pratensis]|uniref:DNA-binding protein n=1 Tax=Agreia pratensis TaxID=150121 RepID=UPI00188B1A0E|nr:DNA-binding protein [Agreia pratensis]MBF4633827.1 DNA-binding protein [Agreia pratensis]
MYVITADQVDSRHTADLAPRTITLLDEKFASGLALPVDRNAGDEIQALIGDADTTIGIILELTRTGKWSVGLGVGDVEYPLGTSTRDTRGPAFIAARDAVDAAKKSPQRFACRHETTSLADDAADFEALMLLLLSVRERRTKQGWQVYDVLAQGRTQRDAAAELGITPQAVSDRMSVAQVRIDLEAQAPLVRLLSRLPSTTEPSKGQQ